MTSSVRPVLAATLVLVAACSESNTREMDGGITFDADRPDTSGDGGMDADAGAPPSDVGEPCTTGGDCDPGYCIGEADGFPGGYCTAPCASDTDCPSDAACVPVGGGMSLCFARCDPEAMERQCRMGYGCGSSFSLPSAVCIPGCEEDSDCPDGRMCDPMGGFSSEGTCYDPGAEVGDPCETSEDCPMGGSCRSEDRIGWPGGTCTISGCDPSSGGGCPDGSHCLPSGRFGRCFKACDTDMDCREAYECRAEEDYPDRRICMGACRSDADCSAGHVCNPEIGTCDVPFDASELGTECSSMFGACSGGTCLSESFSGFPGSYCTYEGCDPEAADDMDGCPGSGVCVRYGGGTICLEGCTMDSDCRSAAYTCHAAYDRPGGPTGCWPTCRSDSVCVNDGFACNVGTGLCTTPFETARLGEPCTRSADCPGGVCRTEAGSGWPAGTCLYPGCRLSGMGAAEDCPSGSTCVDDEEGDPEIGACATSCTGGEPCRAGYACTDAPAMERACLPACTDDSECSGGRTCDSGGTGLCG